MWMKRTGYVYVTLILTIVALMFRVFYISSGNLNFKVKAVAGRRQTEIALYNSKGLIYDRNLIPVSGNQFCYYLVINPRDFDKSSLNRLCELTNVDKNEFTSKLTSESVFIIESNVKPDDISGVTVFEGTKRYPQNQISQHILGYLDSENVVGLSGIEKSFDKELSCFAASNSLNYYPDALNGPIPDAEFSAVKEKDSLNGLVLTIDKELSEFVEKNMKESITDGALVIMDANNGDILSMCSLPGYSSENISKHVNSSTSELVNNAISNQTVGSVFKIIVAACALLNNVDDFSYNCNGGIEIEGKTFICQGNKHHGELSLADAFSESCNSYFIAVGQLLGYDRILETAELFGVDSSFELCKGLYSSAGKIPKDSGILSLANLSIGQGDLMLSPLTVARMTSAICNGGYLVNPNLYKSMYIDEKIEYKSEYQYRTQIFNSEISQKLRKMCIQCVEEGTGTNAMPQHSGAGGKTASAQTGLYNSVGEEILNTYFTGFYPAENPQYVITVFAKNGKSGAATCAPLFSDICDFIHENY